MQRIAHRAWCLGLVLVLVFMSAAHAAPLRLLPPGSSSESPPPVLCLAEYLSERLSECKGVDIIRGKRAARVCSWLRGGTFDYSEQVLWDRIQSYVPLDGMIEVAPIGEDTKSDTVKLEVRVFVATGLKRIPATLPNKFDSDLPVAISKLAERVGQELKLSDADLKIMTEVRIPDTAYFTYYYVTKNVWSPWPVNSYLGVMNATARLPDTKPHWAREAATARAAGGYIYSGTHGRQAEFIKQAYSMVRMPVVRLLGTGHEDEAKPILDLAKDPKSGVRDDIESVLLQIAKPIGYGKVLASKGDAKSNDADWVKELDDPDALKPKAKGELGDALAAPTDLSARTGKTEFTNAERIAALRMLGSMASLKALDLFKQTSRLADNAARESTAIALSGYSDDAGLDILNNMLTDSDDKVAFLAARSLSIRKKPPADFRKRALAMLQQTEPYRTWAAQALAASATAEDSALLDKLALDEAPSVRIAVHRAKYAIAPADPKRLQEAMADPETDVVIAAIKSVPIASIKIGSEIYQQMVRLANDPDNAVAWAARDALWPLRPSDAQGRLNFDLSTCAPYLRHKAVAQLRVSKEPWAKAKLIAACENYEAHTRIAALEAIADDAAAARPLLLKAISDPHKLVRLRAASLLATIADAGQAGAIRDLIAKQKDRATTLYLQDALAKAEGKPAPAPQKPANSVLGSNNLAWLCPHGGLADSPYMAYYAPSHGDHVRDDAISDDAKKAHDAGKAFFSRISPIGNPGTIMVDGLAQDDYWLYLDDQLDTPSLPYIDGVVYGEETMSMDGESLWPTAWRFFCDDTGIDAQRVNGDKKNLTPYEAHAWSIWGQRRCVEGFNRLYDYTKLKFGKLHPGIQVCTFLPEQAGPTYADFEWKFDVGGIYHYVGHTRKDAFSLVRRYKTIWPDRPVLWLSHGIGVYERSPIQYTFSGPGEPIVGRTYRAYTDSLTAWMAGADTGWFSIWAFLPYDWVNAGITSLKGPTITPEEITPNSPKLRMCVDFAFAGVDKFLHDKEELAKVNSKGMVVPPSAKEAKMDSLIETLDGPKGPDAITKKVNADREALYLSFQFYRKHLMDMARLFASLPRNNPKPDVLCVQPGLTVWDGVIGSPGSDLLTYYDFLLDINLAPRLDLTRYKMIAVKSPGALTDGTIEKITQWLKTTPGVLYVHLDLSSNNASQYSTPENFDGKLKLDWPWENDVSITAPDAPEPKKKGAKAKPIPKGESLTLTSVGGASVTIPGAIVARSMEISGKARAIYSCEENPVLAVWQGDGFKGVVVFDVVDGGGKPYREEVRKALAELKEKSGVGIVIDGPQRHEMLATSQWIANTTAGSTDKNTLTGVDMLTGTLNPVVGPGKSAAFVAKDFSGKYAAAYNGISVLCDQPIKKVEKIPGGLRIECDGLMQAASATAKLEAKPDGDALPAVADEKLNRWVMFENTPGIAIQKIGDGKESEPSSLYYIRCKRPVTILTR